MITRDYTQEDVTNAQNKLAVVMGSLYLGADSEIRKAISPGGAAEKAVAVFAGNPDTQEINTDLYMTPLVDTIMPIYSTDISDIAQTGKFEPKLRTVKESLTDYYMLYIDPVDGAYYAEGGFISDGKTFEGSGYGYFRSVYVTNNFRTHAVDIYNLLKHSELDLTKTTAKYVLINNFGPTYYLTDGANEYVMTIGGLPDYTPLSEDFEITRENRHDAATYLGLYTASEFIAAAKDQFAVMQSD